MTSATPSILRKLLPFAIALLILVMAVVVFRSLVASKPQAPDKPVREKVWTVEALTATPETITPSVTLYGRIEAPRSTELTAAVTAFVDQQHVDEGSRVKAGAALLTLDPRDAQLIVAQREAELADIRASIQAENTRYRSDLKALGIEKELLQLAARSVKRFEALKGRNVGTDTQLDDARRNYQQQALSLNNRERDIADHDNRLSQLRARRQQAEVQLESARLDLERTRITAPFDGRIARVSVSPGDRVRSGDALLMMYNSKTLEVRAQIPSRYLSTIRRALGEGLKLSASAVLDGQPLRLQLNRIAGEVGSGRAGIDALLQIETDNGQLEPGRSLELSLQLPEEPGLLALPPQSLYGTDRVYLIRNERLQAIQIERVGEVTDGDASRVLVRSDEISAGDRIITTQLPNAITGLKVRLVSEP